MADTNLVSVKRVMYDDADVHVVNAARISFAKKVDKFRDADKGLLNFLARHNHWTPFAHVRIGARTRSSAVVERVMGGNDYSDRLKSAGFVSVKDGEFYYISGSLYGWMQLVDKYHKKGTSVTSAEKRMYTEILGMLYSIAPNSFDAWFGEGGNPVVSYENSHKYSLSYVEDHNLPRGIQSLTVHCKMPVPIARQVFKSNHLTIVYNEISRRYVALWPAIKPIYQWRRAATDAKQGSSGALGKVRSWMASRLYNGLCRAALVRYKLLLMLGVAPEQARFVLPQGMEVEFYMTAVVQDFERVVELRSDPTAQGEVQVFAEGLLKALREHRDYNIFTETIDSIDNAINNINDIIR